MITQTINALRVLVAEAEKSLDYRKEFRAAIAEGNRVLNKDDQIFAEFEAEHCRHVNRAAEIEMDDRRAHHRAYSEENGGQI